MFDTTLFKVKERTPMRELDEDLKQYIQENKKEYGVLQLVNKALTEQCLRDIDKAETLNELKEVLKAHINGGYSYLPFTDKDKF